MIQHSEKSTTGIHLIKFISALLMAANALVALLPVLAAAPPPPPRYLYRTELVQATPGKLLELIDLYKQKAAVDQQAGDQPALWMRHSQGDRWDLLRLVPMKSYADYYNPGRIESRDRATERAVWLARMHDDIAWEEDIPFTALRSIPCGTHLRPAAYFTWKCLNRFPTSALTFITSARWKTPTPPLSASLKISSLSAIKAPRGTSSPSEFSVTSSISLRAATQPPKPKPPRQKLPVFRRLPTSARTCGRSSNCTGTLWPSPSNRFTAKKWVNRGGHREAHPRRAVKGRQSHRAIQRRPLGCPANSQ